MVLREETTIQIKSLVNQMENSLDLNEMEEDIFPSKPQSSMKAKWKFENTSRCMGNNLFNSVYKCRFRKLKLMLDKGLNVNTLNDYGYNVLIGALHIHDNENRGKMFKFLINRNANPHFKDERHGRSVLSWSCILGRPAELQMLLDMFIGELDLLEKDFNGMTPLHHSCQIGNEEIVTILCKECRRYRLSVDVHDKLGLTPYLHAKRLGYQQIAKVLNEVGLASTGQSDMFTFRSGEEWTELGKKAKERQETRRRLSDFEQAAIKGSSRMMNTLKKNSLSGSVPEIRISCVDEPPRRNTIFIAGKPEISNSKSVKDLEALEKQFLVNTYGARNERGKLAPPTSLTFRGSLALLDLTADSNNFASFDDKKQVQKKLTKVQEANLANIMAKLAEQKTSSYRRGVIVPTPDSQKGDGKKKGSTLAIIFGKKKNRKDKDVVSAKKSCKKEKEKKGSKDKK